MIARPLSYVTLGVAVPAIAMLALAALAGVYRGSDAALALIAVGLIGAAIMLARNLRTLIAWARQPIGTPVPQGEGLWGNIYADIGNRFQRECEVKERLSAELGRFQQAALAMPDGVIYLADDDVIEWMNPMAEQHFDLDRRKDLRTPLSNLIRQPEFVTYLAGRNYAEPLVMRSLRRRDRTLQVQIIAFAGNRRMVLSRDVSQLERLETMRRDFVANVSHELRTPLTVVHGYLDMLEPSEHPDWAPMLAEMQKQSQRMTQLVEDLLTLSRLEAQESLPDENVAMAPMLATLRREAEALSQRRHTIVVQDEAGVDLAGSNKELHSAFSNLVSNAVRYTPVGGTITVRFAREGDGAVLSVRDTGYGIPSSHLPRITERFYRVSTSRSRESGGTGLGLSIVKHVLNLHQARLDIESEVGQGSTFSVHFGPERVEPRLDASLPVLTDQTA